MTVPKPDVPNIDQLHVFVDNSKLSSSAVVISSNSTDYFIYFTFTFHSPVQIDIQLSIPEQTASPSPRTTLACNVDIGLRCVDDFAEERKWWARPDSPWKCGDLFRPKK